MMYLIGLAIIIPMLLYVLFLQRSNKKLKHMIGKQVDEIEKLDKTLFFLKRKHMDVEEFTGYQGMAKQQMMYEQEIIDQFRKLERLLVDQRMGKCSLFACFVCLQEQLGNIEKSSTLEIRQMIVEARQIHVLSSNKYVRKRGRYQGMVPRLWI
ncbi:hypothetical protein HCJ39_07475 [Listeria rocourtiae]|uniref:hypothetical protein n=1 Tax=Listeria rocourtiae TaxID=647910 RepID=UPI0016263CD1|nr:hypothetical protein [Listeria rocourtiae]MBC1435063.1 hypothetical protein [Listeria rocourtiae]MBC1604552.1 hypothetical protein [Listeria rocourtiae]